MTNRNAQNQQASANRLIDLVEESLKIKNLKKEWADLRATIVEIQRQIELLEDQAQEEFDDVEMLKEYRLPQLIYRAIGDMPLDEKIEHEEKELNEVQIRYLSAQKQLATITAEATEVENSLSQIPPVTQKLVRRGRKKRPKLENGTVQLAYKIAQTYSRCDDVDTLVFLAAATTSSLDEAIKKIPEDKKAYRFFKKGIKAISSFELKLKKCKFELVLENGLQKNNHHLGLMNQHDLIALAKNKPKFTGILNKEKESTNNLVEAIVIQKQLIEQKVAILKEYYAMELIKRDELEKNWPTFEIAILSEKGAALSS